MKRKESEDAIRCDFDYGPIFGEYDICIYDKCNEENRCWIENNGEGGYECHPEHKSSLFVNTARPDYDIFFFSIGL